MQAKHGKMIQRIQSLYMALVVVFSLVTYFFVPIWVHEDLGIMADEAKGFPAIIGLIIALTLFSLLQYKKRKAQFVVNRVVILLNFTWMVLVILPAYTEFSILDLEYSPVEIANGGISPLINIVLLVFANRGIRRDENLIKSIDRLR